MALAAPTAEQYEELKAAGSYSSELAEWLAVTRKSEPRDGGPATAVSLLRLEW